MNSAKMLSDKIRMKRKRLKEEGVDNMVDTAALPQMNPQDVMDLKQTAQWRETMDIPDPKEGPSDPADADIKGGSQDMSELKKQMAMIARIINKLSVG